ncbi:MAG: ATP-binding protein [Bryobacteraceae bacterium]|nr:ATP-binding protein [Bryobacteraceae bacterium]
MNPRKPWLQTALDILQDSLRPLPTEANELDWKSGLSPKVDRVAAHLSAFANYPGGGTMVFGIDNAGAILGVSEGQVAEIVAKLANAARDGLDPPVALDHAIFEWQGANLLFVHIPEQTVKPVHLRGKGIEYAWIRSGGTTRKASRQEIAGLILHSQAPRWELLRAGVRLPIDDAIDSLDAPAIAALLGIPLPRQPELAAWMAKERLIEIEGDSAYVTNLGAIAAAKDLRRFETIARKALRIVRYSGRNKLTTIDEQVIHKGYAIGFEEAIRLLKLVLPHSEVIREAFRRETSVYPELALRELTANALIHQDFTLTGTGPMIEIFEDRIEFTNPGALPPGKIPDRLIRTTPQSPNELLAGAFRRYSLCEERGTGFEKVVAHAELYGLPPVAFLPAERAFQVVLFSPRGFAKMSQAERIEAAYQHSVLKYFSSGAMTNTSLRERLKMHENQRTQVSNLIADAVAAGRIKRKDPDSGNKFAEYVPYWA